MLVRQQQPSPIAICSTIIVAERYEPAFAPSVNQGVYRECIVGREDRVECLISPQHPQHIPVQRRTYAAAPETTAPRADANGNDGMGAGRVGSMSPDVLAMFNEAQKNIMELNRSRLKALEELKEAKQRINDLGTCTTSAACAIPLIARTQRRSSTRPAASKTTHSSKSTAHSSDCARAGASPRRNLRLSQPPSPSQNPKQPPSPRQPRRQHPPRSHLLLSHRHPARASQSSMKPAGTMHFCTTTPTAKVCCKQ